MRLMPAGKIYITVPRGGFFHSHSAAQNTGGNKEGPGVSTETSGPSLRREKKSELVPKSDILEQPQVKLSCQGVDNDYGRSMID
jgi:hypothetical protein